MIIRGDGVAAYCCAYLLTKAGLRVDLQPVNRPRLARHPARRSGARAHPRHLRPARIFSPICPASQARGGLGTECQADRCGAFGGRGIRRDSASTPFGPRFIPAERLERPGPSSPPGLFPPLPAEHRFGSRMASATPVTMKRGSDPAACWIESLEEGWLFVVSRLAARGGSAGRNVARPKPRHCG